MTGARETAGPEIHAANLMDARGFINSALVTGASIFETTNSLQVLVASLYPPDLSRSPHTLVSIQLIAFNSIRRRSRCSRFDFFA